MTPEERGLDTYRSCRHIECYECGGSVCHECIADAIRAAVEEERELAADDGLDSALALKLLDEVERLRAALAWGIGHIVLLQGSDCRCGECMLCQARAAMDGEKS